MDAYETKKAELYQSLKETNNRIDKMNQDRLTEEKKRNEPVLRSPEAIEKEFNELSMKLQTESDELWNKYGEFNSEIRDKKLTEAKENLRLTYLEKAESLLNELTRSTNHLTEKKLEIEYPFFKSTDTNNKIVGNSLITDAEKYSEQKHRIEEIILNIQDAAELGRIDYVSRLIKIFLNREVDSFKGQELKEKILSIKNNVFGNTDLSKYETNIDQYNFLQNDIASFKDAVSSGFNYFVTSTQVRNFSEKQTQEFIDNITSSMDYWKNK